MDHSTTRTPVRNLAMDLYRVVAIVVVVLGHWLVATLTYHDGQFGRQDPLVALPWTQWLTWAFQVVPVFFVVAGYASAVSWTRWHNSSRGSRQAWLRRRLARIVGPTAVYVALVFTVVIVLMGVGVRGPLSIGGWAVGMHLWFLTVFMAVVSLTPVLVNADHRWGLAVPAALAVATAVIDAVAIGGGVPYVGWLNYAFCWAAIYQLGIAWQGSRLIGLRPLRLAILAAAALAGLVAWGPYPVSMIGVPGAAVQNTSPPTLAMLAFGAVQAGLVLAVAPGVNRALAAPRWKRPLALANQNVMALYLWHMVPVVVVTLIGYPTGLLPQPTIGTGAWWLARIEWLVVLSVVTGAEVVLLWWKRKLFVAPLPSIASPLPQCWTELTLFAGSAAVAIALARLAADGFAPDASVPLLTSMLFIAGLTMMTIESNCDRTRF
ncbi:acyltransferase family protein [Mycobacterium sp. 21AC1]|uniref:acyltransferase family protein n=1 Tax=[Mycobacterium] appelbergii TaxID=2939269 RepID=UPI002938E519|nr:acyltransferase family protein [Mycobacterium sp. 21AC1]MDV3126171.1 acyltransferase family protein [Mycobacterium sp. 21AC1]